MASRHLRLFLCTALLTLFNLCSTRALADDFTDASTYGFSPEASGLENMTALQKAVDRGGTIIVSQPGVYKTAGTVYIGDNTSLLFGNGVFLKKVDEQGPFSHVLINRGAATKTYNHNITVEGLQIIVNGMDLRQFKEAYGLHGQLAFFYIKDLRVERFRCLDLGAAQYAIHVCTFEDIIINDVIIKGDKDGVHLGRGKRFTISNGVFQTLDDAVALNAHDYSTGNPELGWIEDGVVENCHDLSGNTQNIGYFCRILAGGWLDWTPGMEVQQSDAVISQGRIYRVQVQPDGRVYRSVTRPTHTSGSQVLDGITWGVVQEDVTYTAGVRNVVFRDIFLEKPRVGFSVHFDNDKYSRSYYPGAEVPMQEQILFDNIRMKHDEGVPMLSIATPMDVITITNSVFRNNPIHFISNNSMEDYLTTKINISNCIFMHNGEMDLLINTIGNKKIVFKTSSNIPYYDSFKARISAPTGTVTLDSDLVR